MNDRVTKVLSFQPAQKSRKSVLLEVCLVHVNFGLQVPVCLDDSFTLEYMFERFLLFIDQGLLPDSRAGVSTSESYYFLERWNRTCSADRWDLIERAGLRNALKAQLRSGEVTFGATLGIGNPEASEALGNVGLNWINFDMQHKSLDTKTVRAMIQSISYSQSVPIIRAISNDLGLINRALDIGAQAVIVPLVNSPDDARRAVRAAKYPPEGMWSWGPRCPALRDPDYAETANAEVMVIPQVEAKLALKNLEDTVTTDGIDAVFMGPSDLSLALGVLRQFDSAKTVVETLFPEIRSQTF